MANKEEIIQHMSSFFFKQLKNHNLLWKFEKEILRDNGKTYRNSFPDENQKDWLRNAIIYLLDRGVIRNHSVLYTYLKGWHYRESKEGRDFWIEQDNILSEEFVDEYNNFIRKNQ